MKQTALISIIILVVLACSTVSPTAIPTLSATSAPVAEPATPAPVPDTATPAPKVFECLKTFESREIKTTGKPHIALSADEWNGYLNLMGIQSLCLPVEMGTPFVNADWDSAQIPATGRMVSIGFENLYHGSSWSDIFLIYATYDFKVGTEFDRFASFEDRDALWNHTIPDEIVINGVSGFTRFKTAMWTYENQPIIIYRTVVFPFENYYVAVVYKLGAFNEDAKELIKQFGEGDYPPDTALHVEVMDFLVNSLRFE